MCIMEREVRLLLPTHAGRGSICFNVTFVFDLQLHSISMRTYFRCRDKISIYGGRKSVIASGFTGYMCVLHTPRA